MEAFPPMLGYPATTFPPLMERSSLFPIEAF
jgi:hypothetical protein